MSQSQQSQTVHVDPKSLRYTIGVLLLPIVMMFTYLLLSTLFFSGNGNEGIFSYGIAIASLSFFYPLKILENKALWVKIYYSLFFAIGCLPLYSHLTQ